MLSKCDMCGKDSPESGKLARFRDMQGTPRTMCKDCLRKTHVDMRRHIADIRLVHAAVNIKNN